MTPKEKAKNLFTELWEEGLSDRQAKECALICVDEILNLQVLRSTRLAAKLDRYSEMDSAEYWKEVKQEIQNL